MAVDFIKKPKASDSRIRRVGYDFYKHSGAGYETQPDPKLTANMPKSLIEIEEDLEREKAEFEAEKEQFEKEKGSSVDEEKIIRRKRKLDAAI